MTALAAAQRTEPEFRSEPHRWQTTLPARLVRRIGRRWVIARHVEAYCQPMTVAGVEHLGGVRGPAIIIANHSSHFDTPVVLSVLPERIRGKTAVGAAADRFYRRGKRTWWFSLFFNTFPIVRGGGSATLAYARELLRSRLVGGHLPGGYAVALRRRAAVSPRRRDAGAAGEGACDTDLHGGLAQRHAEGRAHAEAGCGLRPHRRAGVAGRSGIGAGGDGSSAGCAARARWRVARTSSCSGGVRGGVN